MNWFKKSKPDVETPKIIPEVDSRYLIRVHWNGQIGAWYIDEVSPSGKWFAIGESWFSLDQITIIEKLPDDDDDDENQEVVTPRNPVFSLSA